MAEWILKSREFFMKCNRVWTIMKKPTKEEFKVIAQASGLGLLVIGLMGFLISLIFRLTPLHTLF
ncbi:protein translocase SEC61 complex subunit gamma [Nanoarchaeota archaeon]